MNDQLKPHGSFDLPPVTTQRRGKEHPMMLPNDCLGRPWWGHLSRSKRDWLELLLIWAIVALGILFLCWALSTQPEWGREDARTPGQLRAELRN